MITDFLFSIISVFTVSHMIFKASSIVFSTFLKLVLITTDLSLNAFPFVKESYEAPLKIGESREIRLACCAVSFNIEPLLPRYVLIDITNLSRIGSIGGFVTCAKS